MNYRVVALLLLVLSLLPAVGCDKATPVAPNGTILSISANPSKIGLTGRSTITVIGRKPDGNALNPGTEVRLSTDKGTLDATILQVDSRGEATTTFHGDGRSGDAKITAMTGGGMTMATTTVQVGETDSTKPTVLVSASPSSIPVEGSATVTVIARNSDGSPVGAGQQVILTTTLGSFTNSRPRTQADGTATTTLNAGKQAGTAEITAIVGSSDAAKTQVTIRDAATDLSIQANPSTVPSTGGEITLTTFVANSLGQAVQGAPVTFSSERGTLETTGVVFTDTTGIATNKLTLTQSQLTGVTSFVATAKTPSGTGTLISRDVTIKVQ